MVPWNAVKELCTNTHNVVVALDPQFQKSEIVHVGESTFDTFWLVDNKPT